MMLDLENLCSDDQSLVASAGVILSDHSVDLRAPDVIPGFATQTPIADVGRGKPLEILCQVTETFTSTSSDVTCKVALVMADNAAFDSGLTVLYETPAIPCASLIAGYQFRMGTVPPGISKRFLGFRYTTAVHDPTAGKVTAGFVSDKQTTSI